MTTTSKTAAQAAVAIEQKVRAIFANFSDREAFLGDPEAIWIDEPHYRVPAQGLELHTRDEVVRFFEGFFDSLPDLRVEIEELVVAGDPGRERVTVRWRMRGTFTGAPFLGIAATGRSIDLRGIDLGWFEDGRVAGNNVYYDALTFARQIGMLPPEDSRRDRLMTAAFNVVVRLRSRLSPRAEGTSRPDRRAD